MKNNLILSLLAIIIVSCAGKQQVTTTENSKKITQELEIVIAKDENSISFNVANSMDKAIFLINAEKIHIEKKSGEGWEKLKILPCPCDAPCAKLNEKVELQINQNYTITWNMKESWCGTERIENVRNTVYRKADEGTYRIKIEIIKEGSDYKTFYQIFELN